jgi:phage shock protein A
MMRNLRSRLALFFDIKTSAALDQLEDPREVLDYAYGQQQLHLRTVKRGLVEVIAARRQIEHEADRHRERLAKLEEQARRALRSNREDLARRALELKQHILSELRALDRQRDEIAREEERLRAADERLSQRVRSFRLHRTVAEARYAAAEAQVEVSEALSGLAGDEQVELSLAVARSEESIDRLSARASALADIVEPQATTIDVAADDSLDRELDEAAAAEAVERELNELKRELESRPEEASDEK